MKKNVLKASIVRARPFTDNLGMDLEDFCDRKSFYHKARVIDLPAKGERGVAFKKGLVSYNTLVATVTEKKDGTAEFKRTWDGYSATTGRHIAAFGRMFGFGVGKAELDKLEAKAVPGFNCGWYGY